MQIWYDGHINKSEMKPNSSRKHYIEILPAAWLSKRSRWQPIARKLPKGGCLLVTDPDNTKQTNLFQTLTQAFRAQGRQVVLWPTTG